MMSYKILFAVVLVAVSTNVIVSSGSLGTINFQDVEENESSEVYVEKYGTTEPYVELNGTLYYFENNLVANWYAANDFCRKLGLFLVSIETPEENAILIDYIASIGPADYWTALTDLAANNTYTWFTTGERALYFDWHVGQPNHGAAGTARCVSLAHVTNVTKWSLNLPTAALHIICEQFPEHNFPSPTTTLPPTSTTTRPPTSTTTTKPSI